MHPDETGVYDHQDTGSNAHATMDLSCYRHRQRGDRDIIPQSSRGVYPFVAVAGGDRRLSAGFLFTVVDTENHSGRRGVCDLVRRGHRIDRDQRLVVSRAIAGYARNHRFDDDRGGRGGDQRVFPDGYARLRQR